MQEIFTDIAAQLAPSSVRVYEHDWTYFLAWLEKRGGKFATLTRRDIVAYRAHLAETYATATAGRMLVVISRLCAEAVQHDMLPNNPVLGVRGFPKAGETTHRALTLQELRTLLNTIDRSRKKGQRDYALIMLLARTGMRRSEVTALTIGDISQQSGHSIATIRHGKGDKRRIAKLPLDVLDVIKQYQSAAGREKEGKDEPLFVAWGHQDKPKFGPLHPRDVYQIITGWAMKAELDNLSPHGLRATFVTLALEGGARLQQVQYAAGHADPRTTEKYHKRKLNLEDNAADYIKL